MKNLFILLISCILISACNSTEPIFYSYDYTRNNLVIEVDGKEINFAIAVPESHYTDGKTLPLVFALHYGNSSDYVAIEFMDNFALPALREYEAIYVAPAAPSQDGFDTEESEEMIFSILDSLKTKYSIDENRIAVTGYSMGAIGAWYLASRNPELFSAAIPVSGYLPAGINPENSGIPYYVIHSTGDEIIDFEEVENAVNDLKSKGTDIQFETLTDISHYNTRSFIEPLSKSVDWLKDKLAN